MSRRNFGESSGVVVDICTPHGVWFDRGELSQVLSFCASGNLTRAVADAAARADTRRIMDGVLGTSELSRARSESDTRRGRADRHRAEREPAIRAGLEVLLLVLLVEQERIVRAERLSTQEWASVKPQVVMPE